MVDRRRAGFPVPPGIFPPETIVYFHVEGTAIIAEPILNGAVETCYLPAGRGKPSRLDPPLYQDLSIAVGCWPPLMSLRQAETTQGPRPTDETVVL